MDEEVGKEYFFPTFLLLFTMAAVTKLSDFMTYLIIMGLPHGPAARHYGI